MSNEAQSLAQVVGQNVRRLRGQNTLENVASEARSLGVKWSSGSVSTIELGRSKCTIETLATLSFVLTVLGDKTDPPGPVVTIRDLLQTENEIRLVGDFSYDSDQLLDWLSGTDPGNAFFSPQKMEKALESLVEFRKNLNLPPRSLMLEFEHLTKSPRTVTEERLAKKAGIDVHELRMWSFHLWQTSFEEERDTRAGEGASPQKKGRVSRDLLEEIVAAMKGNDRGDD